MQTGAHHDDVIVGMFTYNDYGHELAPVTALSEGDIPEIRLPLQHFQGDEDLRAWDADAYQKCAELRVQRLHDVTGRPDADVRRDVLRALLLDSLVPLSVDAQVNEGIVTLTGAVGSDRERKDATYLAGSVPGVIGVLDELAQLPRPRAADEATREAVITALACTSITEVADLNVGASGWNAVILSGVVQSRSDHDLAVATALSVAGVEVVDDCIQVEG